VRLCSCCYTTHRCCGGNICQTHQKQRHMLELVTALGLWLSPDLEACLCLVSTSGHALSSSRSRLKTQFLLARHGWNNARDFSEQCFGRCPTGIWAAQRQGHSSGMGSTAANQFSYAFCLDFSRCPNIHRQPGQPDPSVFACWSNCSLSLQNRTRFTESQNVRGWKGPLGIIWSNPLPKQGHLQQAAQDHIQEGFEYLQRRRLHNLPGQPVPALCHPQSKEVLLQLQMELLMLEFVLIAPCPVTGHH